VKLVAPEGCVPSWMRSVPPPITAAAPANAPLEIVCGCASCCTETACCVAEAPGRAVISTAAGVALVLLTARHASSRDSEAAASRKAAT
jgi:hypothetical protein